jgi:oligoribonuclease
MKKPRYILWCDFETTGLDIETLAPIEVAFELTDTDLRLVGDETRARYSTFLPCHPSSAWEGGTYAMHVASGLEEAWRAERQWRDHGEVESRITEMLKEFGATDRSVVLGGSSVHFDRRVLERFMPKIVMLLSHRNYDVSTLLIEALASGMPPEWIAHLEASEHRAAADVARSIGLAKRLREWKHPMAGCGADRE